MYANYHTHTYHCNHAVDTPEDYVKEAIKNGIHILGFSDHNPCPFGKRHVSGYRMRVDEIETYVEELEALREKYRDKIEILIGYEAEYYPALWDKTLKLLKTHTCDFLLLGQHFTNNEYDGLYVAKSLCDEKLLLHYVEQTIEGLKTGVFSALAHPDVILYGGDPVVYQNLMRRLCETAKEMAVPLEFNLHGLRHARHYPSGSFWEIAASVGNPVIIGCDAHEALYVGEKKLYKKGLQYLRALGITPIKKLKLIKP